MRASTPRLEFLFRPRVHSKSHKRVRSEDKLSFFRQLATLFDAGTPIHESLSITARQSESQDLLETGQDVADQVAAGTPMWQALGKHPKRFKQEWVEVVRSGEQSGQLGEVLGRLADRIEKAQALRTQIVSALTYPAILAVVALGAVIVMLVEVVPTFQTMFEQMDQELPAITTFVVDVSDFLRARGLHLGVAIVAGVLLFGAWKRSRVGKPVVDSLMLALPLIGDMGVQVAMQRFASNMAMTLKAGISLLDSLEGVSGAMGGNLVYVEALNKVRDQIMQGERFADALASSGAFTPFVIRMVMVGERSGTLPDVMVEVDRFYTRSVATTLERVMGSLETVLVLAMGLVVALILSSVYLPMFSMASGVGG